MAVFATKFVLNQVLDEQVPREDPIFNLMKVYNSMHEDILIKGKRNNTLIVLYLILDDE